jgi:hypothetical protein
MYDSVQRFFVEIDDGIALSNVIPPGERMFFVGRPQVVECVPQRFDLFVTEQSTPGGAWDRHVKGQTMRVHEFRYGSRVVKCDKDTVGPRVDLKSFGVRPVRICESIGAVVENTTSRPLHVRAAFLMQGEEAKPYILGALAYSARTTRRLRVPPSNAGLIDVVWRSDRACLIKRIWLHPERKDMSDLVIVDIKVGNRSQLANSAAVPMEMFSDGLAVQFDPVNFHEVAFVVENLTNEERFFEVEIEAEVDDEPLWMGERATADAIHGMREYPLGFYAEKLEPGATVHAVVSRPQIPFRGERLVVPSSIGHHFEIAGIRVGDRERLNRRPYSASHHSESSPRLPLLLPTAPRNTDIVLKVINTSNEPQRFLAALIGTAGALEPDSTGSMPADVITDAMEIMKETPQFRAIARQLARQRRAATA